MEPIGMASLSGYWVNKDGIFLLKAGEPVSFSFIFTRPLESNETVNFQIHIQEEKFKLNYSMGTFTVAAKQNRNANNRLVTQEPSQLNESEQLSLTVPEELAGSKITMFFSIQRNVISISKYIDPHSLCYSISFEIFSNKGGPKIEEIYWCDSKEIRYGELSPKRIAPIAKNETVYLHIHTRGLFGKQIECRSNAAGTRIVEMLNNVASVEYTFFDDNIDVIEMNCRQLINLLDEKPEKTVTIPYDNNKETPVSTNVMSVYGQIGDPDKDRYASEAKCRLDFRPKDDYDGSFGFSWYRNGELTRLFPGDRIIYPRIKQNILLSYCLDYPFSDRDFPIEGVMGKHYETVVQEDGSIIPRMIVRAQNDSGTGSRNAVRYDNAGQRDNFEADVEMADRHKHDYVKICLDGYINEPQEMEEYLVPVMTMQKAQENQEVELLLLLRVKEIPAKIMFAFDKPIVETENFITLTEPSIIEPEKSPVVSPNISYTIKLKCNKPFDKELRLKVYAIPKVEGIGRVEYDTLYYKEEGKIIVKQKEGFPTVLKELCGMLRILPNDDTRWREIKVVFFNVQTNVNGRDILIGISGDGDTEISDLNKFLAQAYVKANVEVETLDLTSDGINEKYRSFLDELALSIKYPVGLSDLLLFLMPDKYRGSDYYLIFFLPEEHITKIDGEYLSSRRISIVFKGAHITTPAHELFHALGLPHTFNGNEDQGALYTYEDGKTNNIMDYSPINNSLFEWQWYAINKFLNR